MSTILNINGVQWYIYLLHPVFKMRLIYTKYQC